MDDVTLLNVIGQYEQESFGFASGELASNRAYAIERYLAEPYGDEVEGRSQVVDTGLRDTIEEAMPQVLRVFLSGDEVVKFSPLSQEDEPAAKQETDYVNHVILERNDAFNVFSTWFRDAMMCKVGYVKAYWQTRTDIRTEVYKGQPDSSVAVIQADPCVEIIEDNAYPDPYYANSYTAGGAGGNGAQMSLAPAGSGGNGEAPMLHDIKVKRTEETGNVKLDNVPPEQFRVHRSLRSVALSEALFVQHRVRKTLSELRQEGFDVDDSIADESGPRGDGGINDTIEIARDRFSEDSSAIYDERSMDPATRRIWVSESYLRVDYDDDGVAELRRVVHVGNKILSYKGGKDCNEEADVIPFAAAVCIVFPHRHVGVDFLDLTDQASVVSTAITRGYLDNLYLANNGRYGVDINKANIDDLLTSRPGGLIRTNGNPAEAIMPVTHPQVGPSALEGLNWAKSWRESSTGVRADQSSLSSDVLQTQTATAIAQAVSAGQGRIEAIVRSFATGVKELFGIVHALTLKNATSAEKAKINNQWVTVDPREWTKRTGMTITVGLGTGTRQMRVQQLTMLAQMQAQGLQIGVVTPQNLYNTGVKITQEMGYRTTDDFWSDPSKQPPRPPQPNPLVQAEQIKAQAQAQAAQVKAQADIQIQAAHAQVTQASEQARLQADVQIQEHKRQTDFELEMAKAQMKQQLDEREQARAHQQAIEIANINATAQIEVARIKAGVDDGTQVIQATEREAGLQISEQVKQIGAAVAALSQHATSAKRIVRDRNGRAIGIESVQPTVQ